MDRITIEMGMLDILLKTCVKFVPRSHETNYLDIQPRFGSVFYLWVFFFTTLWILSLVQRSETSCFEFDLLQCKICSDSLVQDLFVLP